MKKIGKSLSYLLLFILASIPSFTWAQNSPIQVQAKLSETNIYNGESVLLEFIISGRSLNSIDRPTILDVPGLRWISGSNRQGQSLQYVNGRPSVTYTMGINLLQLRLATIPFLPLILPLTVKFTVRNLFHFGYWIQRIHNKMVGLVQIFLSG